MHTIDEDWKKYVEEQKEHDITAIISEEKMKDEETRKYIDNAFRDGILRTTGVDFDRLIPGSRFGGGNRTEKKNGIIAKLTSFFEKYLGLV